jgi:hypothetical protein
MRLLKLFWFRDPEGYDLYPAEEDKPERIVRRGGELEPFHPIERTNSLYLVFAKSARNAQGLMSFMNEFGPLTDRGLDQSCGESVPETVNEAQMMDDLIRHYASPRSPRRLGPWLGIPMPWIMVGNFSAAIVRLGAARRPSLELWPDSLLDAMWMQLGQAITGDVALRLCKFCGSPFSAGSGTARRADAQFCSHQHQVTFNSLKRSKEHPP